MRQLAKCECARWPNWMRPDTYLAYSLIFTYFNIENINSKPKYKFIVVFTFKESIKIDIAIETKNEFELV
ncbi:hypothetical protein, partial [Aliarcobacter butzleri]|uniref:hypothetical protein n=1 Tax=Aliarcobacter butzleri TaxID=28197 RepID=UPI00062E735A